MLESDNTIPPSTETPVDLPSWPCWSLTILYLTIPDMLVSREMIEQIDWRGKINEATTKTGLRLGIFEMMKCRARSFGLYQHIAYAVAGEAIITSGSCFGRSKVMRILRHCLRARSQGRPTRLRSPGGEMWSEREARDGLP